LVVPGLGLLGPRLRGVERVLLGGWVVTALLFWGVEMLSGLEVRYLVFVTPLVAIAIGQVLDGLASRGWSGRALAGAVVGTLLVTSGLLWYSGTVTNIAPSMVPLL